MRWRSWLAPTSGSAGEAATWVSTAKQDLERRIDALMKEGIAAERIFQDKKSASNTFAVPLPACASSPTTSPGACLRPSVSGGGYTRNAISRKTATAL